MKYPDVRKALFIRRLNRFCAEIELNGVTQLCHIRNTGRCAELLLPGSTIFVQPAAQSVNRKTFYSLICVEKEGNWYNLDSTAPNQVAEEWIRQGKLGCIPHAWKREVKFGNSRFDLWYIHDQKQGFIETKGVTLEQNGTALFPDAPTSRGTKHLNELITAKQQGFDAWLMFIIQFDNANCFTPNMLADPTFVRTLRHAFQQGVQIVCYRCDVKPDEIQIANRIPLNW